MNGNSLEGLSQHDWSVSAAYLHLNHWRCANQWTKCWRPSLEFRMLTCSLRDSSAWSRSYTPSQPPLENAHPAALWDIPKGNPQTSRCQLAETYPRGHSGALAPVQHHLLRDGLLLHESSFPCFASAFSDASTFRLWVSGRTLCSVGTHKCLQMGERQGCGPFYHLGCEGWP